MTPTDARMVADLDAAEALATKGPWEAVSHLLHFGDCILPEQVWSRETLKRVAFTETHAGQDAAADAAFIALARNALPRLCALVREQDAALRLAKESMIAFGCGMRALGAIQQALGKAVTP